MKYEPTFTDGIEATYFRYLTQKVIRPEADEPKYTHWMLLEVLGTTVFDWYVYNDDNRAADGENLRQLFCLETGDVWGPSQMPFYPCSVLEMLIAFSKRLDYIHTLGDPRHSVASWFWLMLRNIDLRKMTDLYLMDENPYQYKDRIAEILYVFMARQYKADGTGGGLFPLKHPVEDQRKLELWYQAQAYIAENYQP